MANSTDLDGNHFPRFQGTSLAFPLLLHPGRMQAIRRGQHYSRALNSKNQRQQQQLAFPGAAGVMLMKNDEHILHFWGCKICKMVKQPYRKVQQLN